MRHSRAVLGFDRRLKLEWLDRAASLRRDHDKAADVRTALDEYLRSRVAGDAKGGARSKTRSVLMRTWALPREDVRGLADAGLKLFPDVTASQRLALHWGMLMASYPFFFDATTRLGRLLRLQDSVELAQLTRRVTETWGQRSTVPRAVQRVVRSLVDWRVLSECKERGRFSRASKLVDVRDEALSLWLVEAVVVASRDRALSIELAIQHPCLFPFRVTATPSTLARSKLFDVVRHGLNESVVVVRERPSRVDQSAKARASGSRGAR